MMAVRREQYRFVVLLVLIFTVTGTLTEEDISRQRRATLAINVLTFALKDVAQFGVDQLLKKVLDDGTSKPLDDIIESLATIENRLSQGFADIDQSLVETPSFVEARKIEAKLLTKMYDYQTLLKSFKHIRKNETQNAINEFKESLREIPDLLFQFDLLIAGKSKVVAGLLPGLAISVVDQQLKNMQSAYQEEYNINHTVQAILDHRNSLITLQVTSIQIYFNNCPDPSSICHIKLNDTYDRIASEIRLFEPLIPRMFEEMSTVETNTTSVYITDPKTNAMLYSNQTSSIVKNGVMDWEKIEDPQDAGLRCSQQDYNEIWILEDASPDGREDFFLKQENGCYMSIDRPFINYKTSFPLFWTNSDKIDRYKFLICLPNLSPDAVTFLLFADTSSIDTTYTLMATHSAIPASMYLNVQQKKTNVYEKLDRRLVLTLFLSDKAESWSVGSEIINATCDDSTLGRTVNAEDNGMKIALGAAAVAVVIILLVVTVCCCKRRCNRDNGK